MTITNITARKGLIFAALLSALVAACGGNDVSSSPDAPPRQAKAKPAPPVKMMRIDKSAYPTPPPRQEKARVVGLLLPLGDTRDPIRSLAGHLYNGAQMALFDANAENLIISLHDTKGTPLGAGEAVKAALAAQVDILVGPLFASSVDAVAPLLVGRDVKALAFSNDSRAADENLFLLGFLPEQNIDRIVSEAIAQGLTRFGALVPEGPYGERIGAQFSAAVGRFGGTVVQSETYPANAKDMFDPVRRLADYDRRKAAHGDEMARLKQEAIALVAAEILYSLPRDEADGIETDALFKALSNTAPELVSAYEALTLTETLGDIPYDAVFMPEGGLALRNLAPLLPYFDIDPKRVKFIGTALWDDPMLAQEPPLHGGWFAAPEGSNWNGFAKRYERIYRTSPPRLASMAYDAVALTAQLAAMEAQAPFSEGLLTNANGFFGLDGIVRLRLGGLNERGLAVREITRTAPRDVSRAPESFVDHDRRMRSALALAESLKRENPDLLLPQEVAATDLQTDTQRDIFDALSGPLPNGANDADNLLAVPYTPLSAASNAPPSGDNLEPSGQ